MSAVVGRVILGVGIGLVLAVIHTFIKNREQNSQHQQQGRGRGTGAGSANDDDRWEGIPASWRDEWDNYSDDNSTDTQYRNRKQDQQVKCEVAQDRDGDGRPTPSSVLKSCTICLSTFEELKTLGVPIWSTPCGHIFCLPCLRRCVGASASCPSCRVSINIRNCHKIFI